MTELNLPEVVLTPEKWMVFGTAVTVTIISLLHMAAPALRDGFEDWLIRRALGRMGREVLNRVVLPDGIDGRVNIDYLVLTDEGVTVVRVKRYPGVIFGGDKVDQWSQVIDNGSYRFPNPLRELRSQVGVVRSLIPGVPVEGMLLFGRDSQFPKGKPDGVYLMSELKRKARNSGVQASASVPDELMESWKALRTQRAVQTAVK